ncbi:MAG: entericidin [Pseudomonadota bacterium]
MTKRSSSKRAYALIALATTAMALAACNTVQGLGEDIESVGRKGEEVIN